MLITVHQADHGTGMGGGTVIVDSDYDLEGQIAEWWPIQLATASAEANARKRSRSMIAQSICPATMTCPEPSIACTSRVRRQLAASLKESPGPPDECFGLGSGHRRGDVLHVGPRAPGMTPPNGLLNYAHSEHQSFDSQVQSRDWTSEFRRRRRT
jgi:hypothetical protein